MPRTSLVRRPRAGTVVRSLIPFSALLATATGAWAGDQIYVPLRWAALEGSQAVTDPAGAGATDTDRALVGRHERASFGRWMPGADIVFRSAHPRILRPTVFPVVASFPVIDDPYPPSAGGLGQLGDILNPNCPDPRDGTLARELKEALAAARAAWAASYPWARGPIALNLRDFAHPAGCTAQPGLRGRGSYSFLLHPGQTLGGICADPTNVNGVDDAHAFVSIVDYATISDFDPTDGILAHELGHLLFLGHGNGLDDDSDGTFDWFCDQTEDPAALPLSVMSTGELSTTITLLQRAMAREVARDVPGGYAARPLSLDASDVFSSIQVDPVHDGAVSDPEIDVESIAVQVDVAGGELTIAHGLFGLVEPSESAERFLAFLDLDGNAGTGGDPALLGFPTGFHGAELVTRVTVRTLGEVLDVQASAWSHSAGGFVGVSNPDIRVAIERLVEQESGVELSDTVRIQLPIDLVGGTAGLLDRDLRVQAIVDRPNGTRGGAAPLDRLPNGAGDGSVRLRLESPRYPTAVATPAIVFPGSTFRVSFDGLVPDAPVDAIAHGVAGGIGAGPVVPPAGPRGGGEVTFTLPTSTPTGTMLVVVRSPGTALEAVTTVDVHALGGAVPPVCPDGVSIELWPPNHDQVAVDLATASGVTDPNGLPLTFTVLGIAQDEPVSGPGSGNTTCDGRGVGTAIAEVRAERAGGGDGRVYHVRYRARNTAELECIGELRVTVPHSQSATAVDGGALHDSTSGCP